MTAQTVSLPYFKDQYGHLALLVDGDSVSVVDADKAPEPVFVKGPSGSQFYIRVGNTTRLLDPAETLSYVQMNWE